VNSHHFNPIQPTRAYLELPDQSAVEAAGIMLDLDTARVVLASLSWLIAKGRSKSRGIVYNTLRGLVDVARLDVVRYGKLLPAPCPDLPEDGWPMGPSILRRLDITGADITRYWSTAKNQADDACLPLNWVLGFAPARIWPAVAALIAWGPDATRVRMEAAVTDMVTQTTKINKRRRPAGSPLARNTIELRISGIWRLLDCLVDLRGHVAASPAPSLKLELLEAWTQRPKRINSREFGARDPGHSNDGPSLEDCSCRLKALVREYETAPSGQHYMRLRRVIWLSLLSLFGGRKDALRTIHVRDYLPDYVWPDGERMPALVIYPGKTWEHDEPHYLPVPSELAHWITEWIRLNGSEIGDATAPLFPTTKPQVGQPAGPLSEQAFYQAIAGRQASRTRGSLALLPIVSRYIGPHPHAFRHTSHQLAIRAAHLFKQERPHELSHIRPEEFASAMAGHELVVNVSARYRDLDRRRICKAVMPYMWQLLWGDGYQQHGADIEAVRQARERRDLLRLSIEALDQEARSLRAESNQLAVRANRTRGDDGFRLLVEAIHVGQEADAKRDQADHYRHDRDDIERDLERALATKVPLPDDLTADEYDRRLAEALGQPLPQSNQPTAGLAMELTTADVAGLFDLSPQAITRWRREGPPSRRPLPWLGGDSAWHTYTKKDHRLRVEAINTAALTPAQQEQLRLIRLRRAQLDAEIFHPAVEITSMHGTANEEHTMNESQTTGRQTVDGLVDAWETSGSSPPEPEAQTDDPRKAS
jgi:hypothetical protein